MARLQHDMIFINLPVSDLEASKKFYSRLGFVENQVFRDEPASFEISDAIVVMLLDTAKFEEFNNRAVVEPGGSREVLNCLSVCSIEDADELGAGLAKTEAPSRVSWPVTAQCTEGPSMILMDTGGN